MVIFRSVLVVCEGNICRSPMAADLILILILVMAEQQKVYCEALFPSSRGRVFLLGHWLSTSPVEIRDPFRQGPQAFLNAYQLINIALEFWLPRVNLERRLA